MAKFNKKSEGRSTTNYMGGKSFKQSHKTELAHALLTSFIEDTYYEKKGKRLNRIGNLIKEIAPKDPVFIGKLALYLRKQAHMRSSFHSAVSTLAKVHRGDSLVSRVIEIGSERPDDLIEILSACGSHNGKIRKIPNQVKKGIRKAINKFDQYQLAKYRAENKEISLVDLLNLTHPNPSVDNEEAFKGLIKGTLTTSGKTWESRLSGGESHKEVWSDLLKKRKLGYMACLRNLRNIIKSNDSEAIALAAKFISNEKAVANSKQLPFRFLSAYSAISESKPGHDIRFEMDADESTLVDALNKAIQYSIRNIPLLEGKTVILSDNSGSMRGDRGGSSAISAHSSVTTAHIANLFAALYWSRANNTWIGLFGDKLLTPMLDRSVSLFENYKTLDKAACNVGGGTETGMFIAFEQFIKQEINPDRIIIFSDCQVGDGRCKWYDLHGRRAGDFNKLFQKFRKQSPDTKVYSVDLRGYGNTLFADGVLELAGWSDKIFDAIQIAEQGGEGFIKQIEAIEI